MFTTKAESIQTKSEREMRRLKIVWIDSNLPRCRLIRFKPFWIDSMTRKTHFELRVHSQIIPKIPILIPNIPKTKKSFSKVRIHHLDSFCNNTKQLIFRFTYFFKVLTTTTYTQSTHMSLSIHEMTLSTTLNNKHNSQSWIQPQFNKTISQFINLSKIYKVPISI